MKTKIELTLHSWMTIEECAAYTGLTVKALYNHVHRGTIPCHRFGKLLRFNRAEIDEAFRAHSNKARRQRRHTSRRNALHFPGFSSEEVTTDGN